MVSTVISEFLESSTIHGLVHISTAKSKTVKAIWVAIVVACFAYAIYMINNSYKEWQESPVSTTITTQPITELEFPTVTVCPPRGSNTAHYSKTRFNPSVPQLTSSLQIIITHIYISHFIDFLKYFTGSLTKKGRFYLFSLSPAKYGCFHVFWPVFAIKNDLQHHRG